MFKYNSGKTNNRLITYYYSNFYPVISFWQIQKDIDELLYMHGLVTRYGPRTNCQRKGLK